MFLRVEATRPTLRSNRNRRSIERDVRVDKSCDSNRVKFLPSFPRSGERVEWRKWFGTLFRDTIVACPAVLALMIVIGPQLVPVVAAETSAPNIVILLTDDMGYGDPRCFNGESKVPTPHMDRMAAEGRRFTDAHSPASVCTPTRYAIMTGRYAWRSRLKLGVLNPWDPALIEPGRPTVASMLQQQGYTTAAFGKWHLGWTWATPDGGSPDPAGSKDYRSRLDLTRPITDGPTTRGFDYFFGMVGATPSEPCLIENDRPIFDGRGDGPKIEGVPRELMERWHDRNSLSMLTEKVKWYLDQRAADPSKKPFLLYFALTTPHQPILPFGRFQGLTGRGEACDFVAQTDDAIGQVIDALDRNGMKNNTLVLVSSDNGSPCYAEADSPTASVMERYEHFPSGPWRGMKGDIHEGGHRVPLIVRWPGYVPAGTVCDETVCLVDLMATFAAMNGTKPPVNSAEDSYNILPALLDQAYAHPIREATVHHALIGMFAIRQGPWKLILGNGSGGFTMPQYIAVKDGPVGRNGIAGQLYNLEDDPGESKNLYRHSPDVVARLTQLLERYKESGRSTPFPDSK